MQHQVIRILILLPILFSIACSPAFNADAMEVSGDSKLESPDESSDFHPPPEDDVPPPVVLTPGPDFCSELDLDNVTWPDGLGVYGRNYLGLALNITGSFEGRSGWANLSSNFDGMGFSIGLLQQNLGTGSLQPMLMDVVNRTKSGDDFQMDSSYTDAIRSMLTQWEKDKFMKQSSVALPVELFHADDSVISQFDNDADVSQSFIPSSSQNTDLSPMLETKSIASANKNTVNWSLKTIYSDGGGNFKSGWNDNLTRMAQSKPYIGLQLKYAMKLYSQAFQYFKAFKLTSVSHFLLMFDFVVQNGGFKQRVFDQFNAKLKAKPKMSAQEKALLILELRIIDVLPRWQSDVISRKKAIIFSEGTVHGAKRNLKSEYCYNPEATVLTQP